MLETKQEIIRFHGRKTEEEKKEARKRYGQEHRRKLRERACPEREERERLRRELREKKEQWRRQHPEEVKRLDRERHRLWRRNNPDKVKGQKKRAYQSRKERGKLVTRTQLDFGIMKYSDLKHNMRRLGMKVVWSREDFLAWFQRQEKKCYYCGRHLRLQVGLGWSGLSLDRLDPIGGYEEGNVVLACRKCNSIKSNWFTPKQMKEIAMRYLTTDLGLVV